MKTLMKKIFLLIPILCLCFCARSIAPTSTDLADQMRELELEVLLNEPEPPLPPGLKGKGRIIKGEIPSVEEPSYSVLSAPWGRSIAHQLGSINLIREKFPASNARNEWFTFVQSSLVESGNSHYRRDLFYYSYRDSLGLHGSPSQGIAVWYKLQDSSQSFPLGEEFYSIFPMQIRIPL